MTERSGDRWDAALSTESWQSSIPRSRRGLYGANLALLQGVGSPIGADGQEKEQILEMELLARTDCLH